EANYAMANFTRDGFVTSVSVSETGDKSGLMHISLHNYGNVSVAKLPGPPDSKAEYQLPSTAGFVTTKKFEETAEACRKMFIEKGWRPYGGDKYDQKSSAGTSMYFKQNAVVLHVWVSTHENRPGQTMIQYGTNLVSVDLPAPPNVGDDLR